MKKRTTIHRTIFLECVLCIFTFCNGTCNNADAQSSHVKRDAVSYNFRTIDGHIYAGGHPLGPANGFSNSDSTVLAFFDYLKSKGVHQIIDLENTGKIQARYEKLLAKAGMKRMHVPMNAAKIPTQKEWTAMRTLLRAPVFVHCKWGADRTGAVLAKYLIDEKGYAAIDAWKTVITGGSCAGPRGGLKIGTGYQNLALWICPDARMHKEFNGYFKSGK